MKLSALKEHRDSASHYQAVIVAGQVRAMATHVNKAAEKSDEKLTAMMNTVLFMAKENLATSKFSKLIDLQKRNGCTSLSGVVYSHSDSVEEMEHCIVQSTIEQLKERVQNSRFIGLIIDETVNITVEKKLIMFLKIQNNGKTDTVFLGNFSVHSGTAECITEKVKEVLSEWNISLEQLVGLGSDGASVMTGRRAGVGVRLQPESPFLVHVHCVAHRVALASADAAKVSKYVAEYRKTLNEIYKLYEYSATRYNRLRELSEILEESDFASVIQPTSVRWLSVGRAVKSTRETWPALVMEIEEEASERKNAVASSIVKKIKTYTFIGMTYVLSDTLHFMDKLVCLFQKDTLNLGLVKPIVRSTIESLQELKENPGKHEQYFNENVRNGEFRGVKLTYADPRSVTAFKKIRDDFIDELCSSLEARFPDDSLSVLSCLDNLLNPDRYPDTANELATYGQDSLQVVLDKFSPVIGQEGCDVVSVPVNRERAEGDFPHFRKTVTGMGTVGLEQTCKLIIRDFSDLYPDFANLAIIALVIPVSSVPAERGFSLQNRLHSSSRNRLCERRLNNLMLLNMHASEECITRAVDLFRNKKRKI
ncbi:uncharacterized protein C17orf113-like [Haliotis asinina]|uniref:uncharacterized protein C17orf113-like n=1 Tax=Haliotis asinina TaxID=109174 RepID=UPI0035324721